jgi:hypothetical protein
MWLWQWRPVLAKTKTPPPVRGGVDEILVNESKPDRRAAQQRIRWQQSCVQKVIHGCIYNGFTGAGQFQLFGA